VAEAKPPIDAEAGEIPIPAGYVYVPVRTTYLEMARPAKEPAAPVRPPGCGVRCWENPPLDEYRRLFRDVGGPWGWTGRLLLDDVELRAVLSDPATEVWRLHTGAEVAGFIELDGRVEGEVEIAYFGLRPDFIGRGLGGYLLRWAVHHVWSRDRIQRFWLHTCDYDHPQALRVYERAGFRVYDEHTGPEAYPADHVARLRARTIPR
jgi:RimJ/RimL family protein N-acetyltransferase